jgi:hypothetical protein
MGITIDLEFYKQLMKKIIEPVNDTKKWFFLLIIINIIFILKLHITIQNFLFRNLITNKYILIPYFIICICSYYFLFTSKFHSFLPKKKVVVMLLVILGLTHLNSTERAKS